MIPLEKAFSRAEEELASDRPEPALAIAGDILRAYPQCLEARRFKAAALAGLSRYEQAAEEYQQIVRLDPLDARTYVELERLSALLGRGDESRRYRVLASDHASAAGGTPPPLGGPITRARLGILTERSRLYMQSIQTLSRLIREVPDRHDLYLVFTRALWLARLKPQLLTMIGITLEVFPGSPLINVIAAWSALECGRDEAYGVHIERARAVDPTGREIERMAMGMLPRDAFHRPRPGIECPSIEGQRIPLGDTVAAMSNGKLEDQSAARDAPLRQFQEERVSVTSGRPIASVERRVSPGPQESAGPEAGGPQEESFTGDAAGRPMSETSPSSAENLSAPAGTSQTSDAAGTANGPSNEPRSDSGPPRDESVTAEPRRSRGIEDFDAWFEEHVLRPIAESPSAAEPHPEPDAMTPRSPAPPNPPGQPGPGVPSGASTSDLPDTHAPVSIGQVAPSGRLGGNAPDASSGPATSSRLEPGSGPPAEGPGFAEEPLPTKSGAGAASKEQQRLAAPANERSLGPNAGEQEPERAGQSQGAEAEPQARKPRRRAIDLSAVERRWSRRRSNRESSPGAPDLPTLAETVVREPLNNGARFELAQRLENAGELEPAVAQYAMIVASRDPRLVPQIHVRLEQLLTGGRRVHGLQRLLGDTYMQMGFFERAIDAYSLAFDELRSRQIIDQEARA